MRLIWTARAAEDLSRVRNFLIPVNPAAAVKTVASLRASANLLTDHPRMGRIVEVYSPREVRRIIAGRYEVRYEVTENAILVLRVMHSRENRPRP